MSFKTFKPLIISFALSLTGSLLMNMLSHVTFSKFWFVSLLFHSLISVLLILLLFRKAEDPKDYTFKIMFVSMGRLLLCMVCLLVYKICDKDNFTHFALHFGLHYILFTAFEMASLLKFIKNPKQ